MLFLSIRIVLKIVISMLSLEFGEVLMESQIKIFITVWDVQKGQNFGNLVRSVHLEIFISDNMHWMFISRVENPINQSKLP